MFTEEFLQHIRERKFYPFKLPVPLELTWDECFRLISTLKLSDKQLRLDNKGKINFLPLFNLENKPKDVERIQHLMESTFHKNKVSCQIFAGIHRDSGSFPVHKDVMDVMYIQVRNSVTLKIYEDENSKSIFSKRFNPGDGIWIPRGTYHEIVTISPRIGYSFGVEGPEDKKLRDSGVDIDPSTYI